MPPKTGDICRGLRVRQESKAACHDEVSGWPAQDAGRLLLTIIHFLTIDSQYELHENSENYGADGDFSLIFSLYSLDFFKVK